MHTSLSLRRHAHGPLAKRLMHMAHISGNASRVSKSSSDWFDYTGFPGDMAPSRKKKAVVFTTVMTDAYQDKRNAVFSKVCEIFQVCAIESLKYVQEFPTLVCYCGDISTPRNVTLNETNCDWLFDISVKRPHGRALTNEGCHLFQTFSRQSEGLATRDYVHTNLTEKNHNLQFSQWVKCWFINCSVQWRICQTIKKITFINIF